MRIEMIADLSLDEPVNFRFQRGRKAQRDKWQTAIA
jgi:hypothetical protein